MIDRNKFQRWAGSQLVTRPLGATLILLVACAYLTPAAWASPDIAQGSPAASSELLTIASVSPWVDSDGEFVVQFDASSEVPIDARFGYIIHQRLRPDDASDTVSQLEDVNAEGPSSGALHTVAPDSVLLLGNPADGLTLRIPIRSTSGNTQRTLIPTPGVHPVTLLLETDDGEQLWSSLVYLNRLPETMPEGRDGESASTAVQVIASVDSSPTLSPQGELDLAADERAGISSIQSLLIQSTDLPITVAARPNTLVGLQRSDDPQDLEFLEALADADWTVARQTYVQVDSAALAATNTTELTRQILVGDSLLGRFATVDRGQWLLDDTLNAEAINRLALDGVRHVVMSQEAFIPLDPDVADLQTRRSFELENQPEVTVTAYDPALVRQLSQTGVDPALNAHLVLTSTMASWFDSAADPTDAFPGTAATIVVPPNTEPATLKALTDPLLGDGPLRIRVPIAAAHNRGLPLMAALPDEPMGDLSDVVGKTQAVRTNIEGYRSMTSLDNATAAEWDLINDQTPASAADASQRESIWSTVNADVSDTAAQISGPEDRTVVLTSGTAEIPLRFHNGLTTEVRLVMTARSSRLVFPEGAMSEIVLPPGETRIDLPIEVRAAGGSLLRISLESPNGVIQYPDVEVPIRSSSISGVGAALSALSLGFLFIWWLRTYRRQRTEAAAGHPSSNGGQ